MASGTALMPPAPRRYLARKAATYIDAVYGDAGRVWLASVDACVEDHTRRWGVTDLSRLESTGRSAVVSGYRDGRRVGAPSVRVFRAFVFAFTHRFTRVGECYHISSQSIDACASGMVSTL